MHARMNHPVMVLPEAMNALQSLGNLTKQGLPEKLLELVHLRASQINGCSVCVDMHPKIARKAGRDRRAPVRGVRLARCALFHRRRARRPGAHRSRHPSCRPRRSGAGRDLGRGRQAF